MSDPHDTLDQLLNAYLEEVRAGTAPSLEDYAAAHPSFADELRTSLPLVMEMEGIGTSHDAPQMSEMPVPDFSETDFKIIRKIGSGGMGVVYEALQISLNRKVALKMLSPARPVEDDSIRRLENEARIIAQLYHPNIVKVHTAGNLGGTFYYVMELLPEADLASRPPATPTETARVGLEAARALAYAHGCGVLHCDIKPSNLFRGADGVLKIGDFGLALSTEESGDPTSTQDGTRRYMAPERFTQQTIGFASDQYSLGATLYEFLAKRPFRKETSTARTGGAARPPRIEIPRDVDPDLGAIIRKSLAEDPSDRYPTMDDMAEDLARYLDHRPVLAARPSPLRRLLLWARRDKLRATACLFAAACTVAFVLALAVGFVNTHRAMNRARANAHAANSALGVMFRHIARQPPSPDDGQLLNDLLPYYESVSKDAQFPAADRLAVYDIISKCAIRNGKYDLAEKVLRKMAACNGYDVNLQSRLAVAIQLQGRKQDADAIWNEIATRFETNGTPDEQAVAARALINAAENAASPNYERAFKILVRVLGTSPNNAKARLEYARLLMDDFPSARDVNIADVPSDPVALLEPIVEQNPTRLYFAMLHVEAIYQRLQKKLQDDAPVDDATIAHALEHADKLFTRFANHPGVAFLAYRTRRACLKNDRPPPHLIRELGRFDEFCLSIFNAPDVPEQDKASILESQLDKLADLIDRPRMFKRNAQVIRNELDKFTGQRAEEFEERYRNLQAKVPDEAFPHFPPRHRRHPFRFPLHDADENP